MGRKKGGGGGLEKEKKTRIELLTFAREMEALALNLN